MVPYLKGFIFLSKNWRENRYFDGWTVYQRVWRRMGGKKRSRRPVSRKMEENLEQTFTQHAPAV